MHFFIFVNIKIYIYILLEYTFIYYYISIFLKLISGSRMDEFFFKHRLMVVQKAVFLLWGF